MPPPRGERASEGWCLLRVALLHGEGALDTGEVLADETTERGSGVGVLRQPRARPVTKGRGLQARRVWSTMINA